MKRKLSLAWMVVEPRRCRAVMVDQVKQGAQHFGAPAFDAQHFGAVHFGAPQFMHLHFVFHPCTLHRCLERQTVSFIPPMIMTWPRIKQPYLICFYFHSSAGTLSMHSCMHFCIVSNRCPGVFSCLLPLQFLSASSHQTVGHFAFCTSN